MKSCGKGKMGWMTGGKVVNLGGGVKAPAYGTSQKLIIQAKGKSTGSKPMDGPDGGPAKRSLSRPGRKHGGRVNRADGGEIKDKSPPNPGELSNVEQNKYLKKQMAKEPLSVGNPNALATGAGAAGLFKAVTSKSPIGKAIGAAIGAAGASRTPALGRDFRQMKDSVQAKYESEKFDKAEKEDRDADAGKKFGGRAKAKSHDKDGDDE